MRINVVRGIWFSGLTGLMLGLSGLSGLSQYTNGIYAEFQTSLGNFTNRLEYTLAPKASANFIGLATGERAWLDLPSGTVRTNPFFNGTTFHRVIAGFMNQGGSPNGLGTDGPGYSFVDEFVPSLRHDTFGILSCANSGPDSNGSQFFVTAGATPWLNDVHTVFGKLYGGSNVVYAINNVATGAGDKPLTNVVIHSVAIRRIGTAAQVFNIHAQGLPVVTNLNLKIAKVGSQVSLTFSNRLNVDNRLFASSNLVHWSQTQLGIETAVPVTNALLRPIIAARQFYRMTQIQYPESLYVPRQLFGRTVTIRFTQGGSGTLAMQFNQTGTGSYTFNGSPGTIIFYSWQQTPHNGRLWPVALAGALDADFTMSLKFTNATSGVMTGKYYPAPYYYPNHPAPTTIAGTFTNSP
jgi:cyclophilin family peptidyl-prolyl cis-trans isomerase